ncbi:hypothetical protein CROQUDRAFT_85860 [Cronartium quercuum f. sp. fusiforme G11]|uniref:Uncharacterized protein n=1 Tax=Cronartium quercuum f. sp. fusiforme G11 TaxID=708437 RepID=A0A9P6THJ0_9BASI|nr:hypothetical protein CROQUDRAFT_85860 [Cronartium quercuum f. sp. fusiforme G11]
MYDYHLPPSNVCFKPITRLFTSNHASIPRERVFDSSHPPLFISKSERSLECSSNLIKSQVPRQVAIYNFDCCTKLCSRCHVHDLLTPLRHLDLCLSAAPSLFLFMGSEGLIPVPSNGLIPIPFGVPSSVSPLAGALGMGSGQSLGQLVGLGSSAGGGARVGFVCRAGDTSGAKQHLS